MTSENDRCEAITKAGTRCRIKAEEGSTFCRVHQTMAESLSPGPAVELPTQEVLRPRSSVSMTPSDINMDDFFRELEALIEELRRRTPGFLPSSATPGQLVGILNSRFGQYAPEDQRQALNQLEKNLDDATLRDLVDGDTWKGLLHSVSHLAYTQAVSVGGGIVDRVSFLPGAETLSQLIGNLEGTSASDLLDPETWQGLWYILNYTAQLQIDQAKQRIMGSAQDGIPEDE